MRVGAGGDVIDDYFRIEHEEPVRVVGNTLTEGTITTVAEVSPTIFEPWRHDTVDPQQRVENTLQTMRRRAVVRVVPAQGGHWVEVQVFKELEDNLLGRSKPRPAPPPSATTIRSRASSTRSAASRLPKVGSRKAATPRWSRPSSAIYWAAPVRRRRSGYDEL